MFNYSLRPYGYDAGTAHKASQASFNAQKAQSAVTELELQVERLLMISEALWEILKEQHGYDDAELIRRVGLIDLRDGKLDGKVASAGPVTCSECKRKSSPRRPKCIFCGAPILREPFAR